ncbi:hypothetical protein H5410_059997 [Solanum commersonii]|uniref:Uncharacterized protein n=1 Tax=Solanum commersonii TaxID=4109 RepID=A0A9J5W4B7_SOLCO|nr:hypothetical protein H5410_059997 [Solanum commersonii]
METTSVKRKIAKIDQEIINITKASARIPKIERDIKKLNFGNASSMRGKARGQGHKGILGLETPTYFPPQIITNHLHKLQSQSTIHNRITKSHHLSTKINHQPTKIQYQITKPMHQSIEISDKQPKCQQSTPP